MIQTGWVHPRSGGPSLEAKGGTEDVQGEELMHSGLQVSMIPQATAQSRFQGLKKK